MNSFTNIELSSSTLDRYYIRSSIFSAIQRQAPKFVGRFLDVGCGKMPYRDYIQEHSKISEYLGLDIEGGIEYSQTVKPDFTWDGSQMPFSDDEFDCVMATEVLEHCPEPGSVLAEIYRVLKPGGQVFFTVPFLWPLHETPYDMYRYTPWSLTKLITEAGFDKVDINALGGWNAAMAQMLGLWIRRSGMSDRKRQLLSIIVKPVVAYLIGRDSIPTHFTDNIMVTGFSGSAIKSSLSD